MIVLPKVGGFWIDPPSVEHNDSSSDAVSSSAASTASSTNEQQQDFKVLSCFMYLKRLKLVDCGPRGPSLS